MKLIMFFLTVLVLQGSAKSFGQTVTFHSENKITVEQALNNITKQMGYSFIGEREVLDNAPKIAISLNKATLKEALEQCLEGLPLTYKIDGKLIMLKRKTNLLGESAAKVDALSREKPDIVVHGKVTDSLGNALIGVTIKVKKGRKGTVTDPKGNYSITVPDDALLIVSYVGYQTKEVRINGRDEINIVLKTSVSALDQLVVIGYGSTLRKDLTGSVSSAPIEDMAKAPVGSFVQALEGRVAGVAVTSPSGQPGSGLNITIRGNNSITQDNSPLFVIDGFPTVSPSTNSISPDDIASIEVLKDASATAIYGARGANGVIIITTKEGKEGPPKITFNASYGIQKILNTMQLMGPYDFVKYQLENNPGDTTNQNSAAFHYLRHASLESYKDSTPIDWQNKIFQVAPTENYNLAIRGGTKNLKYSISGNIFKQDGIIVNSDYVRRQGRAKLHADISNKLDVGINVNYTNTVKNGISPSYSSQNGGSSTKSMMYSIWGYRPFGHNLLTHLFDPFVSSSNDYRFNPVINQKNLVRTNITNLIHANAFLNYKITQHLKLRVSGSILSNIREAIRFNDTLTSYGNTKLSNNGVNGRDNYRRGYGWVNANTLTYDNVFNKYHHLKVLVGVTEQKRTTKTIGSRATHLPVQAKGVSWLSNGQPYSITSGSDYHTLASFLTRVNYAYHSKYLATFSFRADGSSKFAPKNHWSYFPSGALAWKFGKERIFKNSRIISNGKLRLSYGITGNNRVGDFLYLSHFGTSPTGPGYVFGGSPIPGTIPTSLGNANLRWETTDQTDIGLDMGLLKNRIHLTVDLYRKKTTDLLLNSRIPASYGYTNIFKNIGSVQNKGLEVSFNTKNIETKDFTWNSSFNISFNKNKVLSLTQDQHSILLAAPFDNTVSSVPAYIAIVGRSMGLMYGPVWDGVYQYSDFNKMGNDNYALKAKIPTNGDPRATIQPGDVKYKDLNGDGVVNTKDFTVIGRGHPIHTGGFSNNFTYKGFDLNIFFQWSYGNDILNANRIIFEGNSLGKRNLNQFAEYANRWTPDNPSNTYFRARGQGPKANIFSSRVIEDGSYLRLKTVSLGYNLPKDLLNKWRIRNLRVYVSAQNIYTWTNYSGMDPEVSIFGNVLTPGVDYSAYPRPRIITFGIKASF